MADLSLQMAIDRIKRAAQSPQSGAEIARCISSDIATIYERWDEIPSALKAELKGVFYRPGSPGSYWGQGSLPLEYSTPHFKIHYTISGPDAVPLDDIAPQNGVPDYVEVCAEAYERSYRIEVELAGFKAPLDDQLLADNGGDGRYDVYMFSGSWLGFTAPDWYGRVLSTAATAVPFLAMNSRIYDFFGKSEAYRYLETTSAHEFLHAIQFGYNYQMPRWFMEACATWVESFVYDGGIADDGDDIDDPDEPWETQGADYYASQLRYWFLHPDWTLELFDGWHEYGDVIWVIFLTEQFSHEIIKLIYENTSWGTYRGMGNFTEVLSDIGVRFCGLFKDFTEWNYFTADRDNGLYYRRASTYPPIAIHPQDRIDDYPYSITLDSPQLPDHLGSRYFEFLPDGRRNDLWIKIDATDLQFYERKYMSSFGLAGWGVRLLLHRKDGSSKSVDLLLFRNSQEGQIHIENFGTDIVRATLILINMNPESEYPDQTVRISTGTPPTGRLSNPVAVQTAEGGVRLTWELLDLSGIREVLVVRKRAMSGDTDFTEGEAYRAQDRDGDLVADNNVDVIAHLNATDTQFIDYDALFSYVNIDPENPQPVSYKYAVVPVAETGIMGTPAISEKWVTVSFPKKPVIQIGVRALAEWYWAIEVGSNLPLEHTPSLTIEMPNGTRKEVELTAEDEKLWRGVVRFDENPPDGVYKLTTDVDAAWVIGEEYVHRSDEPARFFTMPNPASVGQTIVFSRKVADISIYDVTGSLIRRLKDTDRWDARSNTGEPVSSGIYFAVGEGVNGEKLKTKIAIVK